ncbi:putative mucin/carbohydrate-binding domain-containing protein [Lactococcus taiwanensis]|uniref:putative mucin/carbohydrate-binding domain-containing protein n=1 Tax=Lactococcus taiwanensis TaxID=1151742 RepID=UPI0035126D61
MSNKIITLGATALTALTLAGIAQSTTSFADNKQPQEVLQKEGVNTISDLSPLKSLQHLTKVDSEKPHESVEQVLSIGGQGIGGYSDHSHDSGFARISLKVKDHKLSLVKGSDYQFHWEGWKSSKYASIKLTAPNGTVLYDQAWKGNESVEGNGYQKFGTFAQYDLPEGSTVEVYHAEGPWHRFSTNNDVELKSKLGKSGYTYTYQMKNNQLVLQSVDGKKVDDNQSKNLFLNSNLKVGRKGIHYGIPNWTVAIFDMNAYQKLSSLEDTYLGKCPINNNGTYDTGSNLYKFEDNSTLYNVGSYPCDFIGVNDATHGVTIVTSDNNGRSSCFSQAVDTKPGQKYHFSVDITPNKVTKTDFSDGSSVSSEFLERNFMISCENEDGSHLTTITTRMMKKKGNTYSVDIPAKSNKIRFYIFLGGGALGVRGFYSAQINNLSLIEK